RLALLLWKLGDTAEALEAAQTAGRLADEPDPPPRDAEAKIRRLEAASRRAYMGGSADGRHWPADELDTMAFQLLVAGRPDESRTASEAAIRASEATVSRYRLDAFDMPASYLPSLAGALDELATYLGKVSSREAEAAAAAAEARDIRRELGR